MKQIKKALSVAGILCVVSSMFSFAEMFSDLYYFQLGTYAVVMDGICATLSVVTGIVFLIMKNKSLKQIVDKRWLFVTLLVLNIFNNLIVWAMAFWVELLVSRYSRVSNFDYNHIGAKQNEEHKEQNPNEIVLDQDDYEIKNKVDILTEEIEKLTRLKDSGAITEEEFQKLKQDLINKSLQ